MSSGETASAAPPSLVAFLAARLDEDEAGAQGCMNCGLPVRRETTKTGWTHGDRGAVGGGWQGVRCPGKVTGALPWPDPARVLREVEAKRAILGEHQPGYSTTYPKPSGQPTCSVCNEGSWDVECIPWPCPTVRHLSAIYSGHPGYRQEWKP